MSTESEFTIPALALVVLVGPSGAGKSTFARKHFRPTEVVSSDTCRGLVSDDENDQTVTPQAFEVLQFIAAKRLALGRLTVVDATNVQRDARRPYVALAREHHVIPVAIVLDLPAGVCAERNRARADRAFAPHAIKQQSDQLRRALKELTREGFRHVRVLKSVAEVDALVIRRQPLWNDLRHETGPFDIIGDVHGCFDELAQLVARLGYDARFADGRWAVSHPAGRKLVFLGDLCDRGPRTPDVLRFAMDARAAGAALCVPGNHDVKLMKALRGKEVRVSHGLAESLEQLSHETPVFRTRVADFVDGLVSHYVLDGGRLVVAHAGMKQAMQGRGSGKVREFALYGETTGEIDDYGLPVRCDWAGQYRGPAAVVYGHTPVPRAEWVNHTLCVDTGCVFGGSLTALRWPERELVAVKAAREYYAPAKPLLPQGQEARTAQQELDDLLDLADYTGKRQVSTRLHRTVTIREEQAAAALEVMTRFAGDPRWLIYLPPTMSPCETAAAAGYLEHPDEAFRYFEKNNISEVVCEEKHMGSRAVLVVCRSADAARARFGADDGSVGTCVTRTGRPFFDDPALTAGLVARVRDALAAGGVFDALSSDWVCLDAELMPWSAKAQELLSDQYAPVAAAAQGMLAPAVHLLEQALARGAGSADLLERQVARLAHAEKYQATYRGYCWPVTSLSDLKLAPFHVMASEGAVHVDREHPWHLELIARAARADPELFRETATRRVILADAAARAEAVSWWTDLTARGGEGMVVKPLTFVAHGPRGLVQPAVKCRGREYLRLIYGPDYTLPEQLARLRERNTGTKRSLALRELALGIEALERFVAREPLRRVHECVFGVLALESEPVDPRL